MINFLSKNKEKIFSFFIYLLLFLSLIYPYVDKDWGWHYRYGEYLVKNGKILTQDIYSWTLPGYQWVNHSWLFDPILFFLFKFTGFIGLSITGAVISFLAFYLLVKKYQLSYWKIAIIAFFFVPISETGLMEGFRSQVLALLPLSLLMIILEKAREKTKILLLLPPLFLLWANLHGTFSLGLVIAGIFLAYYFFSSKEIFLFYPVILVISTLFTLINPFSYKIYFEALRHLNNPYLKNVYEWMPPTFDCNYCHLVTFIIYLLLLAFFIVKRKNLKDTPFVITALFLAIYSFSSRRYLSVFMIATLPLAAQILENIQFDLTKIKSASYLSILIIIVGIEYNLFSRLPSFNFFKYSEESYCYYSSGCPTELALFLKFNPPQGKGFNFYDWGGYFIGKAIPTKLFIDGRMHLWKKDDYMPFADYIKMYYQQDYQKFNEYNFDWVILQNDSDLAKKIINSKDLEDWELKFQDNNADYFLRIR